jgi:maltose alpha-D-glucosyltransferase/alpha-amylase
MTNNLTEIDDHIHWYKDAIIYELHIKAFMDHNGDGIGDFMGLLGRLDYLVDLGVTAIWLLPFYPSPYAMTVTTLPTTTTSTPLMESSNI